MTRVSNSQGANASWQVYLLGGFSIQLNGRDVPPLPYRSQTLLAALLLDPSPVRRELLVDRFFPDLPEDKAKARLSDRLWLIKTNLADFPLTATSGTIAVERENVWVDAIAFGEGVQRADSQGLAEALGLYRGELLPEHYDDWLLVEREHLHLLYSRSLQKLAQYYVGVGENHQAIPLLEKILRIEPFEESNLRSLLRAYQATGKRGAALAVYERFLANLRTELDLEPEPATQEVVQAIRVQIFPCRPEPVDGLEKASPLDLLRRCQKALLCGDFGTMLEGLQILRKTQDHNIAGHEIDLLEIDLAILHGDYSLAGRLLSRYEDQPLPLLFRSVHLALMEKQYQKGIALVLPRLLELHDSRDALLESALLADLALAKQNLGETQEALLVVNRALDIASESGFSYSICYSQCTKGMIVSQQGLETDAIQILHQSLAFAQADGYAPLSAYIELGLGINYRFSGKFKTAIQHLENGLSISRDLGLQRVEAEILQELAAAYDYLGQGPKSLVALENARRIYQALKDELNLAYNMYHLAFAMAYHDDRQLDQALEIARKALAILEQGGHLAWTASVYSCIGYIEWLRKNPTACIEAYQASIRLRETLNEMDYIPEMYAYIGLGYLEMGHMQKALENTTRAMGALVRSNLHDIGSEIYFAHSSVLAALGRDEEANLCFTRAYQTLLKYAEELESLEAREAFFRRDPTVRRLMEQVYARGIAPSPQFVTSVVESQGKAAVRVSLMVDAGPPDQVLKNASGEITLRRERLARILRESGSQGVELSLDKIAALMGVSSRTVLRDLAHLKETG